MDIKQAVTEALIDILKPAREYFESHPDILQQIEETFEA
jgi:hypothetical protein